MFSIDINGTPTDCEINFGTALDYELEFGKDMVADVNGSVREGDEDFVTLSDDGEAVIGVNFHAVPWTTLLKVLWCSVRTCDPKTRPFRKWAADMRGIDMMDARIKLAQEMDDCFFRNSAVDSQQGEPDEQ